MARSGISKSSMSIYKNYFMKNLIKHQKKKEFALLNELFQKFE